VDDTTIMVVFFDKLGDGKGEGTGAAKKKMEKKEKKWWWPF
jgi:pyruvate dehydrogenase phosphatase